MKIQLCNPATGTIISPDVAALYFGSVEAGKHCAVPILVKVEGDADKNYTAMKLFLENDGGLKDSQFGYLASTEFSGGVTSSALTGHFAVAPGVSNANYTVTPGLPITLVDGQPADYIWLDIEAGTDELGTTSSINYRFIFEYN